MPLPVLNSVLKRAFFRMVARGERLSGRKPVASPRSAASVLDDEDEEDDEEEEGESCSTDGWWSMARGDAESYPVSQTVRPNSE